MNAFLARSFQAMNAFLSRYLQESSKKMYFSSNRVVLRLHRQIPATCNKYNEFFT